jgi:preprotein translocase subunit SecD
MVKTLFSLLIFVLILSCSEDRTGYEFLTFEVRLAASEPGSHLKEMILFKSDLKFFVDDSVFLQNKDIASTTVIDKETHPKVLVKLTDNGAKKFADFTQENIGRNAAILVGGKLVSAPRINAKIDGGKLIIIGYFTLVESKKIAYGILPNN